MSGHRSRKKHPAKDQTTLKYCVKERQCNLSPFQSQFAHGIKPTDRVAHLCCCSFHFSVTRVHRLHSDGHKEHWQTHKPNYTSSPFILNSRVKDSLVPGDIFFSLLSKQSRLLQLLHWNFILGPLILSWPMGQKISNETFLLSFLPFLLLLLLLLLLAFSPFSL